MTATISPATQTLPAGVLVTYHGSIAHERGNLFYVAAEGTGRYLLIDRDYPNVTQLRGVRRASVHATGQTVNLCDCGHEAGAPRQTWDGCCEIRTCDCTNHTKERSS